ncbi:hypothetical protein [Jannaschia aquimarina]|uniref:GlsB/YeaQ/YmgE family stress response membrane protein n=1 Tax=Jannaschia aquimarina TaxID=935700 RepID=A0A0D1CHS7_9RHOB|nr:hypothetical protein [Jannaschia aquimarina]KIT14242.1 hypothetical protein jaqu_40360 [Jannaschia aquimarina]SNS49040.1 hypothetical protein SAMN05421775_101156 [Jannaschia aquimarina]
MEAFFEGLGLAALIVLALVGLGVGGVIGLITGRKVAVYALIGAVAAMATPFLLAALGVTVLAAGGILLVAAVGAVGAAVIVGIVRAVSRKG